MPLQRVDQQAHRAQQLVELVDAADGLVLRLGRPLDVAVDRRQRAVEPPQRGIDGLHRVLGGRQRGLDVAHQPVDPVHRPLGAGDRAVRGLEHPAQVGEGALQVAVVEQRLRARQRRPQLLDRLLERHLRDALEHPLHLALQDVEPRQGARRELRVGRVDAGEPCLDLGVEVEVERPRPAHRARGADRAAQAGLGERRRERPVVELLDRGVPPLQAAQRAPADVEHDHGLGLEPAAREHQLHLADLAEGRLAEGDGRAGPEADGVREEHDERAPLAEAPAGAQQRQAADDQQPGRGGRRPPPAATGSPTGARPRAGPACRHPWSACSEPDPPEDEDEEDLRGPHSDHGGDDGGPHPGADVPRAAGALAVPGAGEADHEAEAGSLDQGGDGVSQVEARPDLREVKPAGTVQGDDGVRRAPRQRERARVGDEERPRQQQREEARRHGDAAEGGLGGHRGGDPAGEGDAGDQGTDLPQHDPDQPRRHALDAHLPELLESEEGQDHSAREGDQPDDGQRVQAVPLEGPREGRPALRPAVAHAGGRGRPGVAPRNSTKATSSPGPVGRPPEDPGDRRRPDRRRARWLP